MKKSTIEALNLNPRSPEELHSTIERFQAKFDRKMASHSYQTNDHFGGDLYL